MAETRESASRPADAERGTQPGLAGGPGPTPPGFGDNTPRILPDGSPGHPPPGAVEPSDDEIADREGAPVEHGSEEEPSP
jgi:hypothetical protein